MRREIFLHEFVDVVGQAAWPYMEHTKAQTLNARVGFELMGTWYTMGITGRWPQVVNIWDCGGWEGWLDRVDRLGLKRKANKNLDDWWEEAFKLRTGGFDRVLGSHRDSPLLADLVDDDVDGTVFVHELTEVRGGAADEYLSATAEEFQPIAARHGWRLVGLYEVLHTDYEVVTLWATTERGYVDLQKAADAAQGFEEGVEADTELAEWRRRRLEWCTKFREELMTPAPGTKLGPADYLSYTPLTPD